MDATAKLEVQERSRGLVNADANRLSLTRNLWLDFDHGGFTAVDHLDGTMRRDWRLDMQAPFQLASARQDGDQLLVTAGEQGRAGVELRLPQLNLTTVARKESGGGAMPATGWNGRFDRVVGTLHLPTGHRLLAAVGADAAPASWWEQWGLWNVFGVLIVVVFVYWTAGLIPAAIAALGLVLTYQEAPAYIWLWGNLLAALAVARAAPEGRFQKFARAWRTLSFTALGLALLPFLVMQYRYALYPQLSPQQYVVNYSDSSLDQVGATYGRGFFDMFRRSDQPMPASAPAPAPPPPEAHFDARERMHAPQGIAADAASPVADDLARSEEEVVVSGSKMSVLNSAQVVPRYAAGTVLQAGPGVPAWRYNSYNYFWTGPVEAADTVRFIYVGPVVMFFWRIIGVLAVTVLFLWLARLSFGGTWRLPAMPRAMGGAAASALLLVVAFAGVTPAKAQAPTNMAPNNPGDGLLNELKSRLTAPPRCAPRCVEITAANVTVDGERLEVVLQVSALANIAVAMPHASDRWQLDQVTVDARASVAIARNRDASLWMPLTPGAHSVRLSGRLGCRRVGSTGVSAAAACHRRACLGLDGERRERAPTRRRPARAVARAQRAACRRHARSGQRIPGLRARRARLQSRSRLDDRHRGAAHRSATRGAVGGNPAGERRVGADAGRGSTQRRSGAGRAHDGSKAARAGIRDFPARNRWTCRCRRMCSAPRSGASWSILNGASPSKDSRRCCRKTWTGRSGCSATCRAPARSSCSR